MYLKDRSKNFNFNVLIWLIILTLLVFTIIIIGGLTRLTDSGLSMVNWRPIMGTIPPLTAQNWTEVFNLYKQTPEYIIINKNMSLDEFKYIFWWEWAHRFIARIIGVIFFIPFIFFILKGNLNWPLISRLSVVLIFGMIQAVVGWWMVKSGLTDNPYVSAYRLTFHLINALIIFSLLLWLTMDYYYIDDDKLNYKLNVYGIFIIISIILVSITIVSGGFMAGTHAGQSFNTYPLMNEKIIPDDYFLPDLGIFNFFENVIAINFNHRWLGSITFLFIFSFIIYSILNKNNFVSIKLLLLSLIILTFQFLLGILTLLSNVNINYASMHQTNSVLLLATLLIIYHQYKIKRSY
ncbi:MAG: hypothetical protein CMP16_02180 [Rickettsiales bacterium]|nr:hypothetical protein [Rickettsiales bacterium]|tara:strand:+ start:258 stop:1307 length:1050 start_codon:yes stop_codon:yes gene_type:complete